MAKLSGTVYDSAGAAVAGRIVRAYRRDTGGLLGATVSSDGMTPGYGDPDFDKVAVLLHCDGANGSKTFTDSSPSPKSQTVASSGVALSTAQSKFGGASALFGGGYIWLGSAGDPTLAPGNQDFCIEAWCYDTGSGQRRVLCGNASAGGPGATIAILLTTSNTFSAEITAGGVKHVIAGAVTPVNSWYRLKLARHGSTARLFVDSAEVGSVSGVTGSVAPGAGQFAIGSAGNYLGYGGAYGVQWIGHLDDFRYTIGSSRSYEDGSVPSGPFPSNQQVTLPLGAYSVDAGAYAGEAQVIFLDDDGGVLQNDLILRAYPV